MNITMVLEYRNHERWKWRVTIRMWECMFVREPEILEAETLCALLDMIAAWEIEHAR